RCSLLGGDAGLALGGGLGGLATGLGLLGGHGGLLVGGAHLRRSGRGLGLGGGLGGPGTGTVGGHEVALLHGVGDDPAHERTSADGVVVAGDRELDDVGVAVGVDHGDDRDAELVGLGHRDVLLLGVQDEHQVREP